MEIKASIKNYRSTPRKSRLIANLIRGKEVKRALAELKFVNKRATKGFINLLKSAVANAENNFSVNSDDLYIKEIRVDQGVTLKRYRAASNHRALPIRKRLSTISVILDKKTK